MKRLPLFALVAVLVCIGANVASVAVPAAKRKGSDSRNDVLTAVAYPRWGIDPTSATIDIWNVDGNASMADADRVLLDFAEGLQNRTFKTVVLAYRGTERFQLDGSYFKQLGQERAWQNPVYTMRTLPENVHSMNGGSPFGTWTGGLLGVTTRQMEDHAQFHKDWWINSAIRDF